MMNQFDAIRIEGGILSPDIFERLESNDLPGQRPQDFQVSQQRKLIDEIAEAYSDTLKYWTIFQTRLSKLPEKDTATSLTRDSLVIPFLGLLGYRLEYNKTAYKVGELTLSISHRAGDSEQAPPVHIVGIRQQLGRVPESGRPRLSPHALMQEYLNRSDALWGIVTNGSTLRLLRDSLNLRRQSYVEFDLESIFDGNHFQAFSILFRLLHRTRLPEGTDDADRCLLEQYYQHSIEQGSRIRDNLREGVEECIKQLANGLLSHPDNEELRKKLIESSGNDSLSPDEFYRQLLHLVYRFLFLLVSEERGLISNDLTYRDHYSISRLRRLQDSRVFRTEDDDLCCSLRVVWKLFSDEKLGEHLGVAPLNGELFAPIDIDQFLIHNKNLLTAIENLTYFKDSSGNRRRVNYAALDVEELGSVYESLLDLQPCITTKNGKLKFEFVGGTQRKSTGSYYTPQELVEELVKNALEPVIKERLVSSERRVASGEASELTPEEKRYVYNFLSRPSGLAKRDEFGRESIRPHPSVSEGGTLRYDIPNSPGSNLDSGEHCGGMGTPDDRGISAVSSQRLGQPPGAGDAFPPGYASKASQQRTDSTSPGLMPGHRASTDQSSTQSFDEETALTDSDFSLPDYESASGEQLAASSGEASESAAGRSPFAARTEQAFSLAWKSLPLADRRLLLAEYALLSIRVCDPACGSGHFLLAAARRLGKELARIRTGEDEPAPERVREAIRDVVAHSIYGVDKNPLAVELCRVALWLEAHCQGRPLTFLDHRIRCGDSLVGVFDLEIMESGVPNEAFVAASAESKQTVSKAKQLNRNELADLEAGQYAMNFNSGSEIVNLSRLAQEIDAIPDDTPQHVREKASKYQQLLQQSETDRKACDLWTAAFFQKFGDLATAITTEHIINFLNGQPPGARIMAKAESLGLQNRFFHWPVEFPEVFAVSSEQRAVSGEAVGSEQRAVSSRETSESIARRSPLAAHHTPGFDVVLGNPPFIGGLKISGSYGDRYRHWLEVAYKPFGGTADLCAAFYRRVFSLLRPGGRMGMVATNTIGQGDTRESGLAVIVKQGGAITFARRFIKWPGAANVEVNLVAIHKPGHSPLVARSSPTLDGQPVDFISSRLDAEPEAEPKRLPQNEGKAFQGDIVRGIGFVLEPEEAEALLTKDPRNADCLFPYLNGEDLNSHPEQKPSRWVICFHDWEFERARQYPDLLRIVEERVKLEREQLRGPGDKRNREYWWQFGAYRAGMRRAITPLRRVLVRAQVSEMHGMVFVPKGWIYSMMVIVFAFDDDYHFALLQSSVHETWLRKQASSLRTDIRYTPTDCFDTFPFPPEEYRRAASGEWRAEKLDGPFAEAACIGAEYHEHRRRIMLKRNLGLTKTYNLFHDPQCQDADIQRLRDLHVEMDRAILACYGWQDINLQYNFYPNDRGKMRYTASPEARREILRRLLELNLSLAEGG